jgi:acyl-CoA synthetase (AMP-forming)/AMP-acid ligase II
MRTFPSIFKGVNIPQKYTRFAELVSALEAEGKADLFRYRKDGQLAFEDGASWAASVKRKAKAFQKEPFSALAIVGEKSPELAATIFASVIAGKQTLIIDPMESLDKMAEMIAFADAEELIADASFEADEIGKLRQSLKPRKPCLTKGEGDLLFFTSGTSGTPKAVVLTSASLLDSSYNGQSRLPCTDGDIVFSCLPLSHVFGFVCSFLWPLCYQGSVAFSNGLKNVASDVLYFDPTILPLIPSLAAFLLAQKVINPDLKTVLVGAGPLSKAFLSAYRALGIKVAFGYGLTETSSGVAISVNAEDPFAMTPCPEDEFRLEGDGTISIRSSGLMKGYYKNPEATSAVVKNGWLKTADRGFLDPEGNLHILGRTDDIAVLANGTKVDCARAEEKILALLGGYADLAVFAPKGLLSVVAHWTKPEEKAALEQAVGAYNAQAELYAKINAILLSPTPLPRTKTGKIIRYRLPEAKI